MHQNAGGSSGSSAAHDHRRGGGQEGHSCGTARRDSDLLWSKNIIGGRV